MQEIKAPDQIPLFLFLAGSIEMGKTENWQEKVKKVLQNSHWIILNPRRDDWDSSWEQRRRNKQFSEQVEWELKGMERADKILMHFCADTKSPITLLEFGLNAAKSESRDKLIVSCPDGFWRKGNVEIVCYKYGIPLFENLEEALKELITTSA